MSKPESSLTAAPQELPKTQTQEQFVYLAEAVTDLHCVVEEWLTRMRTILREDIQVKQAETPKPLEEPLCRLADATRTHRKGVESATDRLTEALKRVEL